MKLHSILIQLFLLICIVDTFGQNKINFIEDEYEKALKQAQDSSKLLCVFVYDDDCDHCINMKKNVLTNQEVIQFYNENFINLMLNSKTDFCKKFSAKYLLSGFPSFVFLNTKEEHVYSIAGEVKVKDFLQESKLAVNPSNHLPILSKKFFADTTNGLNCYAYLNALKRSIEKNKMGDITKKYLYSIPKTSWITTTNWKIMALGVNDLYSDEFKFILDYKDAFAQITSLKRVENKILNVIGKQLKYESERIDTIAYAKTLKFIKNIQVNGKDSLLYLNDLKIYEFSSNWNKYFSNALSGAKKYSWSDLKTLNEIAVNFYKHNRNKSQVLQAIDMAKRANELDDSAKSNYLIAKLYTKVGDKSNALKYAEKSFKIAKETGRDTKEAEVLLKQLKIGTK